MDGCNLWNFEIKKLNFQNGQVLFGAQAQGGFHGAGCEGSYHLRVWEEVHTLSGWYCR